VAYSIFQAGRGYAVYVQEFGKAEHQVTPWSTGWVAACDWARDSSAVLVSGGDLELWAAGGGDTTPRVVVRAPKQSALYQAKYSPNGRWLAFVSASGRGTNDRNQVVVTSAEGLADRSWLDVVPDHKFADKPRWSADGTMLYFLADEGILLNLWAVRFDPSVGKPVGRPFVVAKFDSPSFKIDPEISFTEMDVSRKFVFLTMRAVTGNIWMLDNADR
jgi:tricorn protease-like protein